MATPLKSVGISLAKNALSPRTPTFLKISPQRYLNDFSSRNERSSRKSYSSRYLDFSQIETCNKKCDRNSTDTTECALFTKRDTSPITRSHFIYLNTPVKSDIMKNGFSEQKNTNSILGKGSFGTVIRSLYKNISAAVKVVPLKKCKGSPLDSNARELYHPNIVKVIDVCIKPNETYALIVMECLEEGRDLQILLDTNCEISSPTKLKYIKDICEGLKFCHKNMVLHLDIKPKNILILPNDQCKICDFGNSYRIGTNKSYEFQGTVVYAAPELLRGMKPTTKCDIYSMGITIWQMEYKESPYEEWKDNECIIYNVVKNDIRPKFKPKDDFITNLFRICWSKNPICRPEAEEILGMI